MTNYVIGNSATHILALIWCKNSNFWGHKVKKPKFGDFRGNLGIFRRWSTLEIPHGWSFIDTVMGISRDDWKCPEDDIYAFWGL